MSRRNALIALGIVVVAIFAFLVAIDPSTVDDGNPNMVDFEFAGSESKAAEIVADWGEEGRDRARLSLWVDYAYLLAYGAFGVLAAAATRDLASRRGWRRLAAVGIVAVPAAAAAASFDAIENVGLLIALDGHGGDLAPLLGVVAASLKFLLSTAVIIYLLAGLVVRTRHRGSASA